MARATGWSSLIVTSGPAQTKPIGLTAYQPSAHSFWLTGPSERATRAPSLSVPMIGAVADGLARTGTLIATGASLGPDSCGIGTWDQSSFSTATPPFSGLSLANAGS